MQKSSSVKAPQQEPNESNEQRLSKTAPVRHSLETPKPIHAPKNDKMFVATKLNQKDMDSACYRLSRVPQKFSTAKVVKSDSSQSYATTYYANNPDVAIDMRPPIEKLEEIDAKLADENSEIDENQRFDLLVQQKSLRFLVFGENSPEAVRSMTALGSFYTSQGHPESAMRHLNKAQGTAKTAKLSENESLSLAVEVADANLHIKVANQAEKNKKVEAAERSISPFIATQTEDVKLAFRRDFIVAEIYYMRQKYAEAVPFYEKAGDSYPLAYTQKTATMAEIYVKGAQAAKSAADEAKEKELYSKAIAVYVEIGMAEQAEKLKALLPQENDLPTEENQSNEQTEEKHANAQAEDPEKKESEEKSHETEAK